MTCSIIYPTRDEVQRLIPNSYLRAEEMRKEKEKWLLRWQIGGDGNHRGETKSQN